MKSVFSFLLLLVSYTAAAEDLVIAVPADKPSFTVTLDANPTTGFQWSAEQFDKALLTLSESHFQSPDTKLIGAGGKMVFTFSLNKGKSYPATTDMVFKYARSWEPKTAMLKKVRVEFTPS